MSSVAMVAGTTPPALELRELDVAYRIRGRWRQVLRGVTFTVAPGESYGLVGESGCGKSTTALAVVQYLPSNGRVRSGSIHAAGRDVLALSYADLRRLRNFQFAARLVVEGFFQGRHRSPYYDFSSEFADYRPYTPGDEIRAIDWRAFARTDRFYIRLYRKETDMNCYLLVDKSHSMAYSGEAALTSGNNHGMGQKIDV